MCIRDSPRPVPLPPHADRARGHHSHAPPSTHAAMCHMLRRKRSSLPPSHTLSLIHISEPTRRS
eukprot:3121752-Prymnesium_polylepis.1